MVELLRDRYELLDVAGHGGEGRVVKALDHQLDRIVALKIRTVGAHADRDALLTEARILLGMSPHPNLPLVREDFFDGDQYVIAMDWVDGIDLAQVLHARGRPGLAPSLVMDWLADAAAALAHLHAQTPPIVHGDVKPANLILGTGGRVTLVDFGVSSGPGSVYRRAGTRGYAAPELGAGAPASRAGDVYSLAATAFALLTGAPPTGVRPAWEGLDPSLAAELEDAIRVALATDPAKRPEAPGKMVERLRAGWTSTLPTGVLTFCLTDIDGAAALWDAFPSEMVHAVAVYDELVVATVEHHGGRFLTSVGDSTVSVFSSPRSAVEAASGITRQLAEKPRSNHFRLRARVGLHTAEAQARDGEYSGPALHGAARVRDLAAAGEVLVSQSTADVVRAHLPETMALVDVGDRVFALVSDADVTPPPGTVCPYPGLVALGAADAPRFFGREVLVRELLTRLDTHRFVALVGASGSGKSSVLRAGVAPAIAGAEVITPGAHPMLACANCAHDGLLVVDQFEETFTLCEDDDERNAFIDLLMDRPGAVVLGIRADFYARCAEHPRLAVAVAEHHVLLGAMTDDEIRRAIMEPARQVGLRLVPGLVDVLVGEVSGEAGGLPLLAHALRATWDARDGRTLTLDAYRATGGVHGAIARTADAVVDALDPSDQARARQLFLRLVEPGEGTEDTRRRASLHELTPRAGPAERDLLQPVLGALTSARLVTVDADTVEVAHEALIREWPRLRSWLDEDRESLRIRRHVTAAADAWDARARDPAELYRGPRLVDALEWLATAPQVSATERAFLEASRAERERADREQVRRTRRLRALLAGTAVALVVALVGATIAIVQSRNSSDASERADVARVAALSRSLVERQPDVGLLLAAEAFRRRDTADTRSTLLSALETHPLLEGILYGRESGLEAMVFSPDGGLVATPTSDGSGTLLWDTRTHRQVAQLDNEGDGALDAAISPDGRWLAVPGNYDAGGVGGGRLQIWDLEARRLERVVVNPAGLMSTAAFSADGRRLITQGGPELPASSPLRVVVWDTATWEPIGVPWRLGDDYVGDAVVQVSRDGRVLAAPVSGSEVRVWNVDDRTPIGEPLTFEDGTIEAIALNANGDTLIVAAKGELHALDPATGTPRGPAFNFASVTITALEVSADGALLAVGNVDGRTQLFDLATGEALGPALAALAGVVTDVLFSADGSHLATAGLDRTGALWRLDGGRSIGANRAFHDGPVTEVQYTPDGRTLVTGGLDGSVVVADAATGTEQRTLDFEGEVRTVALDATGKRIAVGGTGGDVLVLDLATGARTAELAVGDVWVHQVAFDPATGALAIALEEQVPDAVSSGRLIVWDPATDREVGDPIDLGSAFPYAIAWAPDGKLLAVATNDTLVHLYDTSAAHREVGAPIESVDSYVYALAFSPDGTRVATGSAFVRQWSTADHTPVGPVLKGPTGLITGLTYSPDGALLAATTLGLGTTRMWDAATGASLGAELTAGRTPFTDRTFLIDHFVGARPSFSPDGTHLATPSFDGTTMIWDLSADHWLTAACDLVSRNLTRAEWTQHLGTRSYRATCATS